MEGDLGGVNHIIVAIAMFSVFLLISHYLLEPSDTKTLKLNSAFDDTMHDLEFLTYLKAPIDDYAVSDYILYYYHTGDSTRLSERTEEILKKTYGEDVKWKLEVGDKFLTNYVIVVGRGKEYEITLPDIGTNEDVIVRLTIYNE